MFEDENKRPAFVASIDSRITYELLEKAEIGDVVSYVDFKEALGTEVGGGCSHIQYAVKRLLKEGVVFENIRGVGYRRLDDIEIVGTIERDRGVLQRQAKKSIRRLTCVNDFDALPNDVKIKHNAAVSVFGAIASMASHKGMKQVEATVQPLGQKLSLARTLKAFMV